MIRIAIVASTLSRARNLAGVLAEDDRFEIVEAHVASRDSALSWSRMVDVVVAAGLGPDEIPADGPPTVVLTHEAEGEIAFGGSVRAWLPLHASLAELGAAIVAAANDLAILTLDQVRRWLRDAESSREHSAFNVERLTSRELQVLRMVADGLGNKEIAAQLGISDHTAKFHVAQILAKLGANSRTEAVAIGIRRGLIPV